MERNIYKKTLVLGIGNPILGDDGIGPLVASKVSKQFSHNGIDFNTTNLSGLHLMDLLTGYDSLIIIDAIQRGDTPGEITWFKPDDFESTANGFNSQHRVGILQAIKLGKEMGQPVPGEIDIMAIEVKNLTTFAEEMTPEVSQVVPIAVQQVIEFLEKKQSGSETGADVE